MERNINTGWAQRSQPWPMPAPEPAGLPDPPVTVRPPVMPVPEPECEGMVLAMAYVKRQEWGEIYEAETGFERGTIFPCLDLPFMGEGACIRDE